MSMAGLRTINVLLVGRKRVGKTTLAHTLLNIPGYPNGPSETSETLKSDCYTLNYQMYIINIIDTPGYSDHQSKQYVDLNTELIDLAIKYPDKNFSTINLICLLSKAGETHTLDVEVFKIIKQWLGEKMSKCAMLVLTHCDDYTDIRLDEFEKAICQHEISKPIYDYCQLGIVRCGAIDYTKLESMDVQLMARVQKSKMDKVDKMRHKFLNKIINSVDQAQNLTGLPVVIQPANLNVNTINRFIYWTCTLILVIIVWIINRLINIW